MTRSLIVLALAAAPAAAGVDAPLPLEIAALRLGAVDVEASARFYEKHLGFTIAQRYGDGIVVLEDRNGVLLVLTQAERPVEIAPGACHVRFNFSVPDLDEAVAAMESDGVQFAGRSESKVGRDAAFIDPSGHRHNLKQLFDAEEAAAGLHVYDAAIAVSDMPAARAFYETILGFEALSEAYYPPVVPMKPAGSTFFILSEQDARAPAGYDYAAGAFAGLALETPDLRAATARLRDAGVKFLHDKPVDPGAPVILMAFQDPFGNVHELIQYKSERSAEAPGLSDVAFLAGTWEGRLDGTSIRETWIDPHGRQMLGALSWLDGEGRGRMYELLMFVEQDDGLVLRLRHFDGDFGPWRSEAEGPLLLRVTGVDGRVIRLEPAAGTERLLRAVYDGSRDDQLSFRLEFTAASGREPLQIEFQRAP